jgi:dihydrofolate synthase/folylpolyglutamate synthase
VGLDHTAILGDSLAAIAEDKSAIARPACPFVIGDLDHEARAVVERVAEERGAVALFPDNDDPAVFRVPDGTGMLIGDGRLTAPAPGRRGCLPLGGTGPARPAPPARGGRVANTSRPLDLLPLPGRLQLLRNDPPLVLDVAHNPAALELLANDLERLWPGLRWTVVFAAMADKDFSSPACSGWLPSWPASCPWGWITPALPPRM